MISVIIPTYMREEYVQSSIDSVLAQTYTDWELVIVDDGSTDNTVSICTAAAEKDSRIKVFSCDHRGVSAARNKGLEEAKGDYVFFMDSDDLIHPCLLTELHRAIVNSSASAASCLLKRVTNSMLDDPQFYNFDMTQQVENYKIIDGEQLIRELFQSKSQIGAIGGKMFRMDSLNGMTFNDTLNKGEDTFFIYEYALKGGGLAACDIDWYFYRHHDKNSSKLISKNVSDDVFFRANSLMYENEKKRDKRKNARILKKHIIHNFQQMYMSAREQKKKKEAIEIRKKLFKMMLEDDDKVATPRRWATFVVRICCYPVYISIKKALSAGVAYVRRHK